MSEPATTTPTSKTPEKKDLAMEQVQQVLEKHKPHLVEVGVAMTAETRVKEDADVLLCRRLAMSAGKPEAETECVKALKQFGEAGDFQKTAEELAKILGKTKPEIISMVAAEAKPAQAKKE